MYRIGIDVGGTNTDAVIMNQEQQVVASVKSPTTADVSTGIYDALQSVLEQTEIDRHLITHAMLGTTHCTNAIVERKHLNDIAVIRIGAPATTSIKPLVAVPDDLREKLGKHVYMVNGGHEFDGREISSLDEDHLYKIAADIKGKVDSIAISAVFSPVSSTHEQRAAEIFREILGNDMAISLSNEIGSVGLLERENATILNAAVINVAKATANGFMHALKKENIEASVFFGQNDGTLMSVDYAKKYPIYTIACGPTNSLRGASHLSGYDKAIVLDIGGTTSDIGVLLQSFPRESSLAVEIGGARTNFRMPDLLSIGIGGGTIIHLDGDGNYSIGPDSVGYHLTEKALVFGGDTLTITDLAVALGYVSIGDPAKINHLDKHLLQEIYRDVMAKVEEGIDKMKTSKEPLPVILVGGGSVLFPNKLKGASDVARPEHSGVANAIGVSIAQVSGDIEKIYTLDEYGRDQALQHAKNMALKEAEKAGADPEQTAVVDLDDIPLSYLPGNATRISVKAAGPLNLD